ncbi:MAG TPA: hypothetical protein DCY40_04040 [Actinobacteria bacterium]|nr:hypothetical protein [Actinomycetota bacterium]
MENRHVRSFSEPDDMVRWNGLITQRLSLGAHSVSLAVHEPGWRWSTSAGELGAPESCPTHHVGYALEGSIHVVLTDGTEFDVAAGDVFDIPPGHDAWVVGDTPYRAIDWVGARSWLANRTDRSAMIATILFTDVVDSSGEARRRGDLQWTDLNATLAERTRDVVVEYGGQVVKSTGDGTLAVFDGAGRAIRCGLELAALAPHLGLTIRVGIHTGEVETLSGDIHGISVHEAARILGSAGPGEVLISEVTRAIAGDGDLVYVDRGAHDLKGIGARRLYLATGKSN